MFNIIFSQVVCALRNVRTNPNHKANKLPFFWERAEDPVAATHNQAGNYYKRDLFFWNPKNDHNVNLACPSCKQMTIVGKEWPGSASKDNQAQHVCRRVVTRSCQYFLISYRYRCTNPNCRKTCTASDPAIVSQCPKHLQNAFPAVLTHRYGVDKAVRDELVNSIRTGSNFAPWRKSLVEAHAMRYYRCRQNHTSRSRELSAFFGSPPVPFSSFEDKAGYGGWVPTERYFISLFLKCIDDIRPFLDKLVSSTTGKILAIDHSFKIIARLMLDGQRIFNAMVFLFDCQRQRRLLLCYCFHRTACLFFFFV